MLNAQQITIDKQNMDFWNELCGTQLARKLGITDFSLQSLAKFDAYYLSFYPYLFEYIPLHSMLGKRVLEIGLGYGSLAQQLAAVCDYTGLDIAEGPVEITNKRLDMHDLPGMAFQGSILDPPFADASFDVVVTIGCLHHTGNLPRAVAMIRRMLVSRGSVIFMVYNAYSYRRWLRCFFSTLRFVSYDWLGYSKPVITERERAFYDAGSRGAAPQTEFFSEHELRKLLKGFDKIQILRENASPEHIFRYWNRKSMRRYLSPFLGLDLYVTATKAEV